MSEIIIPHALGGTVSVPASKSYAHRLLICAALSKEPCRIICNTMCDDVMSTIHCLKALGADFHGDRVSPLNRKQLPNTPLLDCADSGSTLRFLMPIVAALGCGGEFSMSEGLAKRPTDSLVQELKLHGVSIADNRISGQLRGNEFSISGDISSQYLSGLLMTLPIIGGGKVNITTELQSSKYIDITIDCLKRANIYVNRNGNAFEVTGEYDLRGTHAVEGDWSAAAFWLCAGAIGKKPVTVSGLNPASLHGDRRIVDILKDFGAKLEFSDDGTAVTAFPSMLEGVELDAAEIPDLVPILSVVCAASTGKSRIYNAQRLRYKESDRLNAINIMLTSLGADVIESQNGLIIHGGKRLKGGAVNSFSDHRIAMSAAVASLVCDGEIEIDDFDCTTKSYPDFIHDFISLGGEMNEQI